MVIVLESGFCVVKGIIKLKKQRVFCGVLIKICPCWPKYVDGNRIKDHFWDNPIGLVDALQRYFDQVQFRIFGMKEEEQVMILMSTFGKLARVVNEKYWTVGSQKEYLEDVKEL